MKIINFKIDGLKNNSFVDLNPSVSWNIESDKQDVFQTKYSLNLFLEGKSIWKKHEDNANNLNVTIDAQIYPHTEYTLKVSVENNLGETVETSTDFCTSKLLSNWDARWIRANTRIDRDRTGRFYFIFDRYIPTTLLVGHPLSRLAKVLVNVFIPKFLKERYLPTYIFKKTFDVKKEVKKATIYSSGCGCYDVYMNGKRTSEDLFSPGYTQYDKRIQYISQDATSTLKEGTNTVSVEITGGWYAGRLGLFTFLDNLFGKHRGVLFEMLIEYTDGSKEKVLSDSTWQYTKDGPRRFAEFFDGEIYDANFDNSDNHKFKNVVEYNPDVNLINYQSVPVKKHTKLYPTKLDGNIYDFGRNFAGIVGFKIKANKGDKIVIKHAEILQDGKMYTENLRTARAQILYTAKDGVQEYEPRFTYMGFRFMSFDAPESVILEEIYAYEIYSAMDIAGTFECSNPLLNKLQDNIIISQKANFVEIPTDCPQRDERCGWTGDISMFGPTANFNMDTRKFLGKWLGDLKAGQHKDGRVPYIVPNNNFFRHAYRQQDAVWGDAAVLVPWDLYRSSGDVSILKEQFDSMKKWVLWVQSHCKKGSSGDAKYIWNKGWHYGDWLAPDTTLSGSMARGDWTSTAYFANSAMIVSKVAGMLGFEKEKAYFEDLYNNIKVAFNNFFVVNGHIRDGFQSIYILAMKFGLVEGEVYQNTLNDLLDSIAKNDNHLTTGFVGTPHLLFSLLENGQQDVAFKLLMQDTCPSWLYAVKAGSASIWEKWDCLRPDGSISLNYGTGSMLSFNHYAYGCVGDFLYSRVGGISMIEAGYKKILICPTVGGGITSAKTSHKSPHGLISTEWALNGTTFTLDVVTPANTTALIKLPNGEAHEVSNGKFSYKVEM